MTDSKLLDKHSKYLLNTQWVTDAAVAQMWQCGQSGKFRKNPTVATRSGQMNCE